MKTKLSMELLAATEALAWFKLNFLPSANLVAWVFLAMLLDLITGVVKSIFLHRVRRSSGYRKSVMKFSQYGGAILVGIILGNTLPEASQVNAFVNDGILIFLIYIEATSVFENLYAIDSNSAFSRYFISPVLKLLTFAIKKAPFPKTTADESK